MHMVRRDVLLLDIVPILCILLGLARDTLLRPVARPLLKPSANSDRQPSPVFAITLYVGAMLGLARPCPLRPRLKNRWCTSSSTRSSPLPGRCIRVARVADPQQAPRRHRPSDLQATVEETEEEDFFFFFFFFLVGGC